MATREKVVISFWYGLCDVLEVFLKPLILLL